MATDNIIDSSRNPDLAPKSARRPGQPVAGQNASGTQLLNDSQVLTESQRFNQNLTTEARVGENTIQGQRLEANVQEQRIPVIEESLQVGKREVERGGVRVQSKVVERQVNEQINLREEHVHVERNAVNRPVAPGEMANAFREGTIELTERAEEAVVAKQARVVEEVIVGKEVGQKTQQIHETLRHTEVSIDRLGGTLKTTAFRPFESFDADFRQDYTTNYAKLGTYENYAPLYRYGYNLATARQFAGKDWPSIETDARGAWEEQNPGTWDKVKMAVRHGWNRVTGKV